MASSVSATSQSLDELCINTVRALAMDAVQKAESGHPGTPMALAPLAYALFMRHLRHDPAHPDWPDRDRFVLSCGHASMLLYSVLYLPGYGLTLEDLEQFRQWGSRTPGHPEYGFAPGVETTTGPLGQGFGNAVGMAVAEAHLAAVFNREGHRIVDHWTYFICSDGDLMEGVSHEAASFAGHFKLHKLIGFYDDNHITIDGSTDLTYSDDAAMRFEAYGWHVQRVNDVNDLDAIDEAIEKAKAEMQRPSLIICRTTIGYGSPHRAGTAKAHGEALGEEEVRLTKEALGWPSTEPFYVPEEALAHWRTAKERGARLREEWRQRREAYAKAYPDLARELERRLEGRLPEGWDAELPAFTTETGNVATRAASGAVLNAIAKKVPELMGGSADLTPSNNTLLKETGTFLPGSYAGRNMHFGIREHGMGTILNGMRLHRGIRPYGGTFLVFSDYMRPPIRLAALMEIDPIYVYTHDSIGLGEDGPTHQPIEQLTALRAIPNMTVIRPADAGETVETWRAAMTHTGGPVAIVLTRQKLAFIDRTVYASAGGVAKGAYVLQREQGGAPRVVIIASGSEVNIALEGAKRLDFPVRVVSMPSQELFARQPQAYRDEVLPPGVPRLAVEAAHPMSWYRWVGETGAIIGLERYGASAPYKKIYEELGITPDAVEEVARRVAGG